MWYKAALSFGQSEGTIQCTYAIIYDADGNKLFALQRKGFEARSGGMTYQQNQWYQDGDGNGNYGQDKSNYGGLVYTGSGDEGIFYWDNGYYLTGTTTGYLTIDFPLVLAKKWSGERLVPVTLLPEAVAYIQRTLSAMQSKFYYINVYDKNGQLIEEEKAISARNGLNSVKDYVKSKYGKTATYQIVKKDIAPNFRTIADRLNSTETFFVKPAAFNWHPIDLSIKTDRLKKAEANLNRAKALLAAAGVATII